MIGYIIHTLLSIPFKVLKQETNYYYKERIYFFLSGHQSTASTIIDTLFNINNNFLHPSYQHTYSQSHSNTFISHQNITISTTINFSKANSPYTTKKKPDSINVNTCSKKPWFNYFGARYYNSDLSIWLSVDPMNDKYPSLSPYNYCAGNPVMLVDPDGRSFGDYYSLFGEHLGSDGEDDKKVYAVFSPSSVKKNSEGVITETGVKKDLGITHQQFLETAGFAYNEDGGAMLETASAIENRSETGLYETYDDVLNSLSGRANDNHETRMKKGKYYRRFFNATSEERNEEPLMKNAIRQVIKTRLTDIDFVNGAIGWQGNDVRKHFDGGQAFENWQQKGYKWSENAIINGSFTPMNFPNHVGSISGGYSYTIVKSAGGSIFWKINK